MVIAGVYSACGASPVEGCPFPSDQVHAPTGHMDGSTSDAVLFIHGVSPAAEIFRHYLSHNESLTDCCWLTILDGVV